MRPGQTVLPGNDNLSHLQPIQHTSVVALVTGRIKTNHLTILQKLRVLSQTSPYEQFAWVCLRSDPQLPSHLGWVDFAQSRLVRTAPDTVAPSLHLRCTSVTPPLHLRYTSVTPPLHLRCTSVTPPLHLRYTSVTPLLHLRCTFVAPPLHLRKRYGGSTEVLRRYYGGATEVLRRCNGGTTEV